MTTILEKYSAALAGGLLVTVQIFLVSATLGISLGLLAGAAASRLSAARRLLRLLALVMSSIPLLVILIWCHYPLQSLLRVNLPPFASAVIALSSFNVFIVADATAASLAEFPSRYEWPARLAGLSATQITWRIRYPLILRNLLPSLITAQVLTFQGTLFASLISVDELFRTSQRINAIEYKPVEIYSALAFVFIITCVPALLAAHWYRDRYAYRED